MALPGPIRKLADNSDAASLASAARRKRFTELTRRFPDLGSMRVLDLGGAPAFWRSAPVRPAHVTVVNLDPFGGGAPDGIEVLRADACDLPESVRKRGYDLTFSNSVIEHVGGHHRRLAFADAVRTTAPHYWIQTPYRYFPIEPHWVFPGQQFLPAGMRAWASARWRWGHIHSDASTAIEDVLSIELLSVTELRHYFPDAEIYRERFLGLTKSITAVA